MRLIEKNRFENKLGLKDSELIIFFHVFLRYALDVISIAILFNFRFLAPATTLGVMGQVFCSLAS